MKMILKGQWNSLEKHRKWYITFVSVMLFSGIGLVLIQNIFNSGPVSGKEYLLRFIAGPMVYFIDKPTYDYLGTYKSFPNSFTIIILITVTIVSIYSPLFIKHGVVYAISMCGLIFWYFFGLAVLGAGV